MMKNTTEITEENLSVGKYIVGNDIEINSLLKDGGRLSTFMYKIGYSFNASSKYNIVSMSDGWTYNEVGNKFTTKRILFEHLQNIEARYATKEEVMAVIESQTNHYTTIVPLEGKIYVTKHIDKSGNEIMIYDVSDTSRASSNLFNEYSDLLEGNDGYELSLMGNCIFIAETEKELNDRIRQSIIDYNLELIEE